VFWTEFEKGVKSKKWKKFLEEDETWLKEMEEIKEKMG